MAHSSGLPNCTHTCWVGGVLSFPKVAASGSWQALVIWLHRLSFEAFPANRPDEVTRPREIELTPEFKKARIASFQNSVPVVVLAFSTRRPTQFDRLFAKGGCSWATHRKSNSRRRNSARDRSEVGRSMADRSPRLPEWSKICPPRT